MSSFDPNAPASAASGIFGLPYTEAEADLVLLPVPWAVTVSYGGGADRGPKAIFDASMQVDLYDPSFPKVWACKTAMAPISKNLKKESRHLRILAETYMEGLLIGELADTKEQAFLLKNINAGCNTMNQWVEKRGNFPFEKRKNSGPDWGRPFHAAGSNSCSEQKASHSFCFAN